MKLIWMLLCLLGLLAIGEAANQQAEAFRNFLKSRLFRKPSSADSLAWFQNKTGISPNYIQPQDGSMDADKIGALPGQPKDIGFNQYAGYVTVDSQGGRALFYYFVESPVNSSKNPLVLWLNGGPGCSSLIGAFSEVGPFRINSDGKTLYQNNYAWNNVANVIFLDSPVGIGYSYSNTTTDYLHLGDQSTAADAYTFLVNWLERFPQYKTRDFYIIGENYAGHFVPQLAYTILVNNKNSNNQTLINLKGIAVGNGWIDDHSTYIGSYDYLWSHGFNSDETNKAIHTHCPFDDRRSISPECFEVMVQAQKEIGPLNDYNIYAPDCPLFQPGSPSLENYTFDPCTDTYMIEYLSRAEVQTALHAKLIHLWDPCSLTRDYRWTDTPVTVLPIIQNLTVSGLRVWLYSGDLDALIPVTATRYGINLLKLSVKTAWRPWLVNHEVGGHVVEYEGLTWVIVRGAGQAVPSYQPERALTMISSFLQGTLPPP